jgi:hypothetical protein
MARLGAAASTQLGRTVSDLWTIEQRLRVVHCRRIGGDQRTPRGEQ